MKTATAQNPGLLAAYSRWQSMLERVPQARALPDPTVNFAWFIREIETRVGPQKGKIGIKQMFPWFGKLKLRAKIASQAADAAKQQYEMLKLELFYKIKKAYAQYYFLGRSMAILRENITLLQFLERVAETKYKAGSTPYATMLRTRVEVDKLNLRLLDTEESLTPVATELNALLNRGFDTPFPVPQDLPATSPDISIAQLKQWVAQNNPALKSLDFMTAKAQTNIKLAKKNLYPDFGLGLEYMFTASVDMGGMMSSGKDPLAAMASLKIPLWFKKNKAAINQANALHRAAVEQKKEVNNNLTVRLEKIVFSFNKAKRKMKLYKESLLLKAEQALNVTRSAFEAGEASFADYIDSQRTLLSFQLEYERAKTEHMQQAARLEMLAGRTL
ncbi:MAG: TolC family protein [bacterium]|nr:TolC family protein [bacterium]